MVSEYMLSTGNVLKCATQMCRSAINPYSVFVEVAENLTP